MYIYIYTFIHTYVHKEIQISTFTRVFHLQIPQWIEDAIGASAQAADAALGTCSATGALDPGDTRVEVHGVFAAWLKQHNSSSECVSLDWLKLWFSENLVKRWFLLWFLPRRSWAFLSKFS